jgi:O-antigen/teichoic acid export membrane protein
MDVELAPHNTFLQAFVETGIVGLGLVIAAVVVVFRELRKRRHRPVTAYGGAIFVAATGASVAYLLQMPTENLLNHATLQWPLWVLLAAAFELTRTPEELAAAAPVPRRLAEGLDVELEPPPSNELPRIDDEDVRSGERETVAVLVHPPSAVVGPAPTRHRWWRSESGTPGAPATTPADGEAERAAEIAEEDESDAVVAADAESDRDGGRSLSRLLLSSSGTGIVLFVANFVSGVITARLLDPDGRGEVLAAMTFVTVIGWMLMLSFDTAMTVAHGRRDISLGEATGATLLWVVATSAIGFVVGWVLIPHFFRALEPQAVDVARLALLAQLPTEAVIGAGSMFGAAGHYRTLLVSRAAPGFVHAVFVTALALGGQLTVRTTILSYIFSAVVVAVFLLPRLFALVRPKLPSWRTIRSGSWFGLRAQPGQISGMINMRLDVWLLPLFVAAADIGYYGVAVNVASAIMLLLGQFAHVLVPVMSNADEQTPAVRARALRLGLSVASLLGVALFVFGPTVINVVYGQEFDPAGDLMRILVPGIVALVGGQIIISLLNAAGRPGLGSAVLVPSVVITIVGLLVFLPRYGVTAAATVSTISYAAMFLVALVALRSAVGVRFTDVAGTAVLRAEVAAARDRFLPREETR